MKENEHKFKYIISIRKLKFMKPTSQNMSFGTELKDKMKQNLYCKGFLTLNEAIEVAVLQRQTALDTGF
jgi:hypothetical protein